MNSKLIRDKIPEILDAKKIEYSIKILEDTEFAVKLNEKLQEEILEYLSADSTYEKVGELVDILEIIYTILEFHKFSIDEFIELRREKLESNGGFKKKILLLNKKEGKKHE